MKNCCLGEHIVHTIYGLLKKLSLNGQIRTIEIGDEPVSCSGGLICISHKTGCIEFESNSERS